jgi:polyhydroxyalkanoate synthesis regulator phasin
MFRAHERLANRMAEQQVTPPDSKVPSEKMYCYRCQRLYEISSHVLVGLKKCEGCGAALIPWQIDRIAHVLHIQDKLLEEGKKYSKLYEQVSKDLAEIKQNSDAKYRKLYEDEAAQLREAQSRREYWKEQTRRKEQEIVALKDQYFDPQTHEFVPSSQTASAGVIGRVRLGWGGAVYRLTDLPEVRRLIVAVRSDAANGGPTVGRKELDEAKMEVQRLRDQVANLAAEADRLRSAVGEAPTRSRRTLE